MIAASPTQPTAPALTTDLVRTQRILVVEDDEDLSTAVVRIAGSISPAITVDWAGSAVEARRHLRARPYDLILADYYLEGIEKGSSLIVESRSNYPATKLTMMSALPLADFVRVAERELPIGVQILPKPFSAIELRAFLYEVLEIEPARHDAAP